MKIAGALRNLCLLASSLPLLAACGGSTPDCIDPEEPYLGARSNAPLHVPDGMTQPNRSEALAIPDAKPANSAGRTACLDAPPSYFRSTGTVARSPEEVVASWAQAWANREADAVLALYSTQFVAPTDTAGASAWLEQRREQVAVGPLPDSRVENLRVESDGADRRTATFTQRFGTNVVHKELVLVREAGSWRIAQEKVVEVK
ncbi:MAG TPA: hypothetical protein VFO35_14310 [Steroidobacteraceae bacterium]|nr:hypothetical protein [Steroidobacteraceae bacterium]